MIRVGDYIVTPDDEQSVLEVLRSNRLSEGKKVREFEEKWAQYCGTKYAVMTNSGTSALILALEVLKDITKERDVLTSPLTFIATINAIVLSGFNPYFSDVAFDTFGIAPTFNDKAIFLPVHLYGYPVDMDKFQYRFMIEDACEAHGSYYKNKRVGSIGIMGCFSFYIAHNIQFGDGGAVTTNDEGVYKALRSIKAHGRVCECPVCRRIEGKCPHKNANFDPRFTFKRIAYNFKSSEIQAVLGLNQLKHADEIMDKRQQNVKYLNEGLSGLKTYSTPLYDENTSYLAYPILLDDSKDRNEFCRALENEGVENRPFFSCVPTQQPAYAHLKEKYEGKFPKAEYLGNHGFHIGCHQYLKREELDKIISVLRKLA
jgi:CDP-6-deoxy-D-xylo-4-hexulose-3-dehydrase